jgi:hypothetical protein
MSYIPMTPLPATRPCVFYHHPLQEPIARFSDLSSNNGAELGLSVTSLCRLPTIFPKGSLLIGGSVILEWKASGLGMASRAFGEGNQTMDGCFEFSLTDETLEGIDVSRH